LKSHGGLTFRQNKLFDSIVPEDNVAQHHEFIFAEFSILVLCGDQTHIAQVLNGIQLTFIFHMYCSRATNYARFHNILRVPIYISSIVHNIASMTQKHNTF
jgi:hypothetical protein